MSETNKEVLEDDSLDIWEKFVIDTPLDMCYDCLFSGVTYNPIPSHIKVDDIMNVNPDQLRLQMQANEKELLKGADEWLDLTVSSLKTVVAWIEKKQEKFKNESR